jgi:hypothetical protein
LFLSWRHANKALQWHYCIEIVPDFKGLSVRQEDVELWMQSRNQLGHKVEVAEPAKLIVRFQDYQDAQFFYFSFRGAQATFRNMNDNEKPRQ